MRLRHSGLVAALVVLCALPAEAQSGDARGRDSLTLRGSVRSFTVEEDGSNDYVRLELRYELVNTGPTPVILLKRRPVFTGLTLARTQSFAPADVIDGYRGGPSVEASPAWAEMRRALDKAQPPPALTELLMPEATSTFDASVTIVCPKKPSPGPFYHPSLKELEAAGAVWLKVYYQVWSPDLEPDARRREQLDFGRGLRSRWKSFGDLRLDDLQSEPILLNFSTATPHPHAPRVAAEHRRALRPRGPRARKGNCPPEVSMPKKRAERAGRAPGSTYRRGGSH